MSAALYKLDEGVIGVLSLRDERGIVERKLVPADYREKAGHGIRKRLFETESNIFGKVKPMRSPGRNEKIDLKR